MNIFLTKMLNKKFFFSVILLLHCIFLSHAKNTERKRRRDVQVQDSFAYSLKKEKAASAYAIEIQ